MWNENKNIHGDCVHVMYELGKIDSALILPYAADFIKLLKSKEKNMIDGAMTALAEIAKVDPDFIFKNLDEIKKAKETGTDVAVERFVSALAHTASANEDYSQTIFPDLLAHLSTCNPSEVPQYAELTLPAVNESTQAAFIKTLKKRNDKLSGAAFTRLAKIIRLAEKIA
jgi:hypothetical protein